MDTSENPQYFIGLMSGTSFDGIDVGLLKTNGIHIQEIGPTETYPYSQKLQIALENVMGKLEVSNQLVADVTIAHIEAVKSFIKRHNVLIEDIRAIGFHGQTIFHQPKNGVTLQIGDGKMIATAFRCDVVDQFRIDDVNAGGEGAPLAPIFHKALLAGGPLPCVMVNIGGLSNVTWTDRNDIVAFDSGIGNARLDDWVRQKSNMRYDKSGLLGLSGKVDEGIVRDEISKPYYNRPPPKSLDRNELLVEAFPAFSLEDGAATLAAITADAIVKSSQFFPSLPTRWVLAGGGRHNQMIVKRMRQKLGQPVVLAEDAGFDGDGMEAHLIAYLAARFFANLPSTFVSTTGAAREVVCGRLSSA